MNNKIIVAFILLFVLLSINLADGLSCYEHDYCLGGCPKLTSSIVECQSSQSKCWKFSSPLGVKRGCGDNRCRIQVDTGIMGTASVCCSSHLCNSAISIQSTIIIIFASLFVVFFA